MPAPTPTQPPAKTAAELIQEDISEAQKKAASSKPPEGTLSDFAKKFQGSATPDGQIHQGPIEGEVKDDKQKTEDFKARQDASKKPSYVKTVEAERDALSAEKESLTKKIDELSTQLASAKTQKDFDAILAERDTKIQERDQTLDRIRKERDELKSKVTLYDLTEDPTFVKEYVEPINLASRIVMESIEGDQNANEKLTQLAALNNAFLSATDPEQRRRFKDQRDMLKHEIAEELPVYRRDDFTTGVNRLIELSKMRAEALADHSKTFERYQNQRREASEEASRKTSEIWGGAFKEVSEEIESIVKIPESVQSFITANNIVIDTARDEDIALSSIKDGARNYTPKDVAKILKQGAVFGKLKATIDAQQKIIDEQNATISELKGSGTRGNGSGGGKPKEAETEEKGKLFFSKFQPPR